ncbi:hypothetical protein MD484_g3002, partial [Candolleomyces efflorescens]
MMIHALQFLDTANLIRCAQVSRILNLLAIQVVLDQRSLWDPQKICSIKVDAPTRNPPDTLSALLRSVHITKMGYTAFDFTQLPSFNELELPLTRASRLVARLESLDDVAFHFNSMRSYSKLSSKKLGKLCQAFAHILNLMMAKSCSKLQFAHLDTSPLGEQYSFKRSDKHPHGILNQFKGYFKDGTPAKSKLLEEEIRYSRNTLLASRMVHILPSPQSLELATKLTRLDTGSINLFRPPFSSWILPILQASRVTHLSIGMKDLPADKEESQYVLDRLAAAVPNIILLTIYNVANHQVYDILSWIGKFSKLGTLSLPLNFPTKLELGKIDLHLPELWRFECASNLLPVLFQEECQVNFPKLNSVAITHHGFDIATLAESIPSAREMVRKKSGGAVECLLFLALRLTTHELQSKVTQALRDGVRPTHKSIDFSKGFEGVSPLELSLPGTREDIRLGIYDNDIMGILTLSPDVFSLILSSTEWYLKRPAMYLEREHVKKFRKRSPTLHSLVVY